jgi:hypothetical protein
MTRGAAISIALLALIALMLIMLLGRHGGVANSPAGADLTGMANPNVHRENPDAPVSTRRTGNEYGVFDETTGKCVGTVSFDKVSRASHKSYPTRTIRLFDSKYVGIFNTHMECVAFVKGVEVVLDCMGEGEGREEGQVASEPHVALPHSKPSAKAG